MKILITYFLFTISGEITGIIIFACGATMKLKKIHESQYKDTSTFMDRTQVGTQYSATNINDTLHKKDVKKKAQPKVPKAN